MSGETVLLFHPIEQTWSEHFRFKGYEIEGQTATGSVTVFTLVLNYARRQLIRKVEPLAVWVVRVEPSNSKTAETPDDASL